MASSRVTGSESLSHYTACELHVDEELEEYCSNHNVLLCRICVVTNHFSCTRLSINDKITERNQKESVDVFTDDFQNLQTKFQSLKSEQEGNKLVMINNFQGCFDQVKQIRTEINLHFDKIEKDLTDSIKKLEKEQLKHAECRIKSCKQSIEQIDLALKKLKHCRTMNDDEVLFIQKHKWIHFYEKLQEAYSSMDESVKPNLHTEILKDERIDKLSEEIMKMGQVVHRQELIVPANRNLWVTGSAFLPDGRLVCTRYSRGLVMYSIKGLQLSSQQLKTSIHQIASVSTNMLVGTVPDNMEIQFVQVLDNTLTVVKTIETERPCYGIDVLKDKLYITCYDSKAEASGEIVVMSMEGKPLRRFNNAFNNEFFRQPNHVCVNESTSCVYVIESAKDHYKLILLSQDGKPHDWIEKGYFVAICRGSNQDRMFVLRSGFLKTVVGATITCCQYLIGHNSSPCTISYRQRDNALFVGYINAKPQIYFLND